MNFTTMESVVNGTMLPYQITFSWYDFIFFGIMLGVSMLVGIYFGCFGSKQSTKDEYLMGGKQMKVIPIAISLVASHTSGISLLALPADVYRYGATYLLSGFSLIFIALATIYVYLPVFYKMQVTSIYEYLEIRFDSRTRIGASFLFTVVLLCYLPIVIYIPSLAFSAASGIRLEIIAPVICGVCIFYTTIGGLKAVVWTDTLQFVVTISVFTTIFILGITSTDGLASIWRKAQETDRLDFLNFQWNPTQRDSFWHIFVGLTVYWIAGNCVNQSCIQKFLSLPTLRKANESVIWYCFGMFIINTVCVITGLIMVKKYSDCDPFTTKVVSKNDGLLPYYVMDVAGHIPGVPGLFIAGICSASLSTLSAHLNCVAGTLYEDFVSKILPSDVSEEKSNHILKLLVIIIGVICTGVVFIVQHLGGLLPLTIAFVSLASGPLLGIFNLGLLAPKANSKGAFYGSMISLICMATLIFTAKYYEAQGLIRHSPKLLSTDNCDFEFNVTQTMNSSTHNMTSGIREDDVPRIFKLSFYYYTLIGSQMTFITGLIISYLTNKGEKGEVNRDLISPVVHFLLPKEQKKDGKHDAEYLNLQMASKMMTIHSNDFKN